MNEPMIALICAAAMVGCGGNTTPANASSDEATGSETGVVAIRPNTRKLETHIAEHLKLPATRQQVLEACAEIPEFSAAEQQWLSNRLPEGNYATTADVSRALGL